MHREHVRETASCLSRGPHVSVTTIMVPTETAKVKIIIVKKKFTYSEIRMFRKITPWYRIRKKLPQNMYKYLSACGFLAQILCLYLIRLASTCLITWNQH